MFDWAHGSMCVQILDASIYRFPVQVQILKPDVRGRMCAPAPCPVHRSLFWWLWTT